MALEPLWTPSADRIGASNIEHFRLAAERLAGVEIPDTIALHRWSIDDPAAFWSLVWDESGVIGTKGDQAFAPGGSMREARFFPNGSLNFAENLIEGRSRPDDEAAIIYRREDGFTRSMSRSELRAETAALAAAFRAAGVEAGDRVAAWMPHVPETIVAMLAAASIGAVFTSTSADFGTAGVIDRFGQVEPKVLIAADGYHYGGKEFDRRGQLSEILEQLPTVELVVVVGVIEERPDVERGVLYRDLVSEHAGARPSYERLPFDHPIYILYSSGTTGKPKCMVHRAGGVLLKHLQEQQHHVDVRAGDRVFYFTTCGWMMWNWLASILASGAGIVLFDGNPFHPGPAALFDLADDVRMTLMGVSAKFIDAVAKSGLRPMDSHDLEALRVIASTGSPLSPDGFRFVYEGIKTDVHLASVSGGTDLCGCFVAGDPTRPVFAGEIQGPGLGMAVEVFDDDGNAVTGSQGELVCTKPFPSMPLTFWGEDGDERYRQAYFDRYPDVWTHGDYALWTERGGMVILGRSDATLNSGGVRIGTAEIYRIVEQFPEVAEAVAVAQRVDADTRVVLFLRMAEGFEFTSELEAEIRRRLRTEESPRHVPEIITTVADIPRTRSGKITELAVMAAVNGDPVKNTEALANPEALDLFRGRTELA
ncbi:MAG: acetoacetate--CoA ligase [Acidimicrobiia bacterium]|nr:acetoacetate--CoA ligase [Acidimicrobiia bacterium]MDH5294170.1 acetoacetate--CoA ligase [Acidimicrobiia bacterium]